IDDRVVAGTARAGYRFAVTTEEGLNHPGAHPLRLRRMIPQMDFEHFVQTISGFEELQNSLRGNR
ncbi:hypothetical protein ACI3PL_23210, partial [Lacticaseibacillus paracasei]